MYMYMYSVYSHMFLMICIRLIIISFFFSLQIFHLHLVLAVQDILCVWVHVASVSDHDDSDHLRYYCLHLLPSQLGRL